MRASGSWARARVRRPMAVAAASGGSTYETRLTVSCTRPSFQPCSIPFVLKSLLWPSQSKDVQRTDAMFTCIKTGGYVLVVPCTRAYSRTHEETRQNLPRTSSVSTRKQPMVGHSQAKWAETNSERSDWSYPERPQRVPKDAR